MGKSLVSTGWIGEEEHRVLEFVEVVNALMLMVPILSVFDWGGGVGEDVRANFPPLRGIFSQVSVEEFQHALLRYLSQYLCRPEVWSHAERSV